MFIISNVIVRRTLFSVSYTGVRVNEPAFLLEFNRFGWKLCRTFNSIKIDYYHEHQVLSNVTKTPVNNRKSVKKSFTMNFNHRYLIRCIIKTIKFVHSSFIGHRISSQIHICMYMPIDCNLFGFVANRTTNRFSIKMFLALDECKLFEFIKIKIHIRWHTMHVMKIWGLYM